MSDLIWISSIQQFRPRQKANRLLSYRGPRSNPKMDRMNFQRKQGSRKGLYRSH